MLLAAALLSSAAWAAGAQAAVNSMVSGEIQRISIDNAADVWSGGTMVVGGGHVVTIPRNLLMDLPANRLTLQQLYAQAPAACIAAGETGLAKGDTCNASGAGAIATITANYTNAGNVVAGDVFVQKGIEAVTGVVTFIDYNDGYFRLNGIPGDAATGVMVRLNDPDARHTIQQGLGCAAGNAVNCSPDPRFTLDPDNYTNVFATGYPVCLPSAVARTFVDVLGLGTTTAQAAPDGTGDVLCPTTNRNPRPVGVPEPAVADSRRFAPIVPGDSVTAEGNFETVAGVRFLSAHSTMVAAALSTQPGQPDYMFLDEVEIDVAGFQNARARSLIIGFTTVSPPDVLIWGIHYDPVNNAPHEFPLASSRGCDIAAGAGTCGGQGLVAAGANIFKIRHDVDFLLAQQGQPPADKPRISPCAHLRAEPRFGATNICPSAAFNGGLGSLAEEFAILSPIPREIQARTGHSLAHPGLVTIDVSGNQATNGQYLFPFGVGLGGVSFPEMVEINLAGLQTANIFEGIPWALDRRLSPGGCIGACEASPQPLDPFPVSGLDPRTQAVSALAPGVILTPQGPYNDPNFTASPLSNAGNRILSYVDASLGKFNGNATVLAWPPVDPAALPISAPPEVALVCAAGTVGNSPPVAASDFAVTLSDVPVAIAVLGNDTDPDGNALTVTAVGSATNGVVVTNGTGVTYTPNVGFTGQDAFTYTVSDGQGGSATAAVSVTVDPAVPPPPVATDDSGTTPAGVAVTLGVLANDLGDSLSVVAVTPGVNGTVTTDGVTVTYTPSLFGGTDSFTYTIMDVRGATATGSVVVTVQKPTATGVILTPAPIGPQVVGTPVVFTAAGQGSFGYQYRFWYRNTNSPTFLLAQDWSAIDTWTLPASLAAGTYRVVVHVRTTTTGAFEAQTGTSYTLTTPPVPPVPPATGVTMTSNPASPQVAGTPVVFTAAGQGSTGYQYRFFLKDPGSTTFTMVQDYGVGDTWTLASSLPGTYRVVVHVRTTNLVGLDAQIGVNYTLSP